MAGAHMQQEWRWWWQGDTPHGASYLRSGSKNSSWHLPVQSTSLRAAVPQRFLAYSCAGALLGSTVLVQLAG